jgi:hypothetical protein
LALDNEQPDFPFVYVNWNVDRELGEEDNNEKDEKNTITKRSRGIGIGVITWITLERNVSSWKGEVCNAYDLNVKLQLKLHPTHPTRRRSVM